MQYLALIRTPSSQQSSQGNEQDPDENFKEEARKQKRSLGGVFARSLWSYRTTIQMPTRETPFSPAFGSKAVIPVEVSSISFRVKHFNPKMNDEGICVSLDLLSEKREEAQMTMAAYQQRTARYFNKKVKPRQLQVGDWVLRKVSIATRDPVEDKLGPT